MEGTLGLRKLTESGVGILLRPAPGTPVTNRGVCLEPPSLVRASATVVCVSVLPLWEFGGTVISCLEDLGNG